MAHADFSPVTPAMLSKLTKRGGQTRISLQTALGVSGPTIARAAAELTDIGILAANTGAANGKGRPAETIDLSATGLCSIGISIRADRSSARLLGARGNAVECIELGITQETPYQEAVATIGDNVLRLASIAAERFTVLAAVGISFFGSTDYEHGKITTPSTFKAWHHKPIARDVELFTGLPTAIENYSIALVNAVNWFDAEEPADFFLVVADYGIGGVSSIAGRHFLGPERRPSGFGHIGSRPTGRRLCHCGGYDCQTTTASVRAIRDRAEEYGLVVPGRGDLGALIRDLDTMDDARARALLDDAGDQLAGNALTLCRGMGLPLCVLGGVLFDHSASARQAANRRFADPGHNCRARFLAEVFSGRDTDDLAATSVAYHHLSQTRKAYLLQHQQELGSLLLRRTR